MNLEESDLFIERQKKNNAKKRMIMATIVFLAIIVILLIIMIIIISYQDSLKLKMYIDGRIVTITPTLFIQEGEATYINIKEFSEMVRYDYQKGEYKKYTEDIASCYLVRRP